MDTSRFEEALARVKGLKEDDRLEEAYELIEELLKEYPLHPTLLIKKSAYARLLGRLQSLEDPSEAIDPLEAAIAVSPHNVEARIELGYVEYALKDDSEAALKIFEEAGRVAASSLIRAYEGRIKSLVDLGLLDDARVLMDRLRGMFDGFDDSAEEELEVFDVVLNIPEL